VQDRQIAQQRLYILHLKLRGFVQRREQSVLAALLPAKEEYVLTIRLSRM
jgi:RAD54-like protein 2